MSNRKITIIAVVALAATALLLFNKNATNGQLGTDVANQSPEASTTAPVEPAKLTANANTKTVAIETATDEAAAVDSVAQQAEPFDLENARRRDFDGLKEEVLPDGSIKLDLQGRFQHVISATVDENGKVIISE